MDPSASRPALHAANDFLTTVLEDEEFQKKRLEPNFLETWDGVIRLDRKS